LKGRAHRKEGLGVGFGGREREMPWVLLQLAVTR
jgi:hypothetical protein